MRNWDWGRAIARDRTGCHKESKTTRPANKVDVLGENCMARLRIRQKKKNTKKDERIVCFEEKRRGKAQTQGRSERKGKEGRERRKVEKGDLYSLWPHKGGPWHVVRSCLYDNSQHSIVNGRFALRVNLFFGHLIDNRLPHIYIKVSQAWRSKISSIDP